MSNEKTYRCGWCQKSKVRQKPDGTLATHIKPGTASTECKGYQTYNENGRSR